MAIYWLKHFDDKIPTPTSKGTWEDSLRGGRHRPTVAAIVHLVRRFFHQLGPFLGVDIFFSNGQSLLPLAVHPPQGGLHIRLSQSVLAEAQENPPEFRCSPPNTGGERSHQTTAVALVLIRLTATATAVA